MQVRIRPIAAVLFVSSVLVLCLATAPAVAASSCESLAGLKLPNTTITLAASVGAGGFTPPAGAPDLGLGQDYPFKRLPPFCRVTGTIKPTQDSNIQFEVWMPSSGWNGRLQGIGNGGFAGVIPYSSLTLPVARGYAAATTDTGHVGQDASWAPGHPEKVIDFGYRAIHLTAANAKLILEAFYGRGPQRSYFSSCSNGGRQALMEAQRYPADYDGIIAGAPANFWTHLFAGFVWNMQAMSEPGSYISPAKLKSIETAVVAACDARDGATDGLVDPQRCIFDLSTLLCKGAESAECLTESQVRALKKIYTGPRSSSGVQLFPGYSPGGETGLGGWGLWVTGLKQGASFQAFFANQFFGNMVYANPSWDYRTFSFDKDMQPTDEKLAKTLNAIQPDLRAFQKRGGKLILYHGQCDAAIPPQNTINYYRSLVASMGQSKVEKFTRLFMIPGVQHCFGGPGPNSFGQMTADLQSDAVHDITLALERWVEKGVPPDHLIATKYNGDKPSQGVVRTRPLCAYPQVAVYKDSGSLDDAASFVCTRPR